MRAVSRRELQKDRFAMEHSEDSYVQVEEIWPNTDINQKPGRG